MKVAALRKKTVRKGFSSLLAIFFVTLFSVLAISFAAMSNVNVQMSRNHRDVSISQAAAESGLEYAKYLVNSYVPPDEARTPYNTVSADEASDTFGYFAAHVQTLLTNSALLGGKTISLDTGAGQMRIPSDGGVRLTTDSMAEFAISFELVTIAATEDDPEYHQLVVTSSGYRGEVDRALRLVFPIRKGAEVLKYAVAGRGRIWLTGDSTVHGDIYSSWKYQNLSPFNITSDSTVEGTIGTILETGDTAGNYDDLYADGNLMPYDLETLDAEGNPMYDGEGNKIISSSDEVQGDYEGINYDVDYDEDGDGVTDMPGMKLSDYDTSTYYDATRTANGGGGDIYYSSSATQYTGDIDILPSGDWNGKRWRYEKFPHDAGSYTTGTGLQVKRYIYKNQTFTDARLPDSKNALFINCTFNGILYVDCGKTGSTYNNVRFEDCAFNGPIVTDTPNYPSTDVSSWWKKNCLYFTGEETFQIPEEYQTTILAPNFNVNLGNTSPDTGETNVLTGAVVGGIVDIRGEKMLPSGITTPVVIADAQGDSYMEL